MTKLQITPEESQKRLIDATERLEALSVTPEAQEPEPEYLDVKQAAKFLHLSPDTLYGHTSAGTIPHIKRGKRIYFEKAELVAWLHGGRRRTAADIDRVAKSFDL